MENKPRREARRRQANALLQGILDFLEIENVGPEPKLSDLPKRFTIYEPMLLLPPTFIINSDAWKSIYDGLGQAQRVQLFSSITTAFCQSGHNITHVAINAPIAPILDESDVENVMRSPIHLQDLHGDFGPTKLLSPQSSEPTEEDFDSAFWVQTSQLTNIKQVWAPRWSMFSRGNIREKARILGVAEHNPSPFPGLDEQDLKEPITMVDVVDMYVGIGYFAISYLRRGVRRVFGWDINPWSIESLRRGCVKNGFQCKVVKIADHADTQKTAEHVSKLLTQYADLHCIAFLGDNRTASKIIAAVVQGRTSDSEMVNVRHCNLGLLPSSEESWEDAIRTLNGPKGGWLHVHENADMKQVDQHRLLVESKLRSIVHTIKNKHWKVKCEHTEMVKTYAPGVGHFVFDIWIGPSTPAIQNSNSVS